MDAIELLTQDHATVRQLLGKLAETTKRAEKTRADLLAKVKKEIEIHTMIEEEIFYPAFREAGKNQQDEKMFFEALEEHRAAGDLVLPDLEDTEIGSDEFGGRAKVLKELIEHHADEEEEKLFPRVRELMNQERLDELGELLAARKRELADEMD